MKQGRRLILTISTLGIAGTSPLLGQTAPPAKSVDQRPINTQMMMQHSGGSLLQASLPNADVGAKTPAYSFYAVPPPEPKVLRKHDLVSIIVQQTSTYQSSGTTNLQKTADLDAKVDQFVQLNLARFSLHGTGQATNPVEVKMEGARDFKGDASVDRSDTMTLRLEAEVIDVKPNGTLVIQAKNHIKNDEEDQTIILTGVCRVQDVDASNSVLSTDLHDLDLQKITKGAVRDTTKRGLLPRLFDFINPF